MAAMKHYMAELFITSYITDAYCALPNSSPTSSSSVEGLQDFSEAANNQHAQNDFFLSKVPLQARINFVHDIVATILRPISTSLRNNLRQDPLLDPIGLLHCVDIETRADMPCNVAMQWPDSWIIRVVLNHDISRYRSVAVRGL